LHLTFSKGVVAVLERLLPVEIIKAIVASTAIKNKPAQILRNILQLQYELQH
jgi:hypothetical protein